MNAPRHTRHADWQLRLEAFARERAAMPFAWGVNDCAIFAADAIEALTGAHCMPQLRGLHTARQALKALASTGGLHAIATAALGPAIASGFAAVGDVVLVRVGKREALTICNGVNVIGPGSAGLVALPLSAATAAWRV